MSGRYIITGVLAIGVAFASFAWWYHWQQGRHALALWGSDTAQLIRYARSVQLARVRPAASLSSNADRTDSIPLAGGPVDLSGWESIDRWRGLVHLRQALLEDASYVWQRDARGAPRWQYALRFADDKASVLFLLDVKDGYALRVADGQWARLAPKIAAGLRQFFDQPGADDTAVDSSRSQVGFRDPKKGE